MTYSAPPEAVPDPEDAPDPRAWIEGMCDFEQPSLEDEAANTAHIPMKQIKAAACEAMDSLGEDSA